MIRRAFACILVGVGALTASATLVGAQPDDCSVPEYLTHVDGKLPHVGLTVKEQKKLDILVVGTGSSMLGGPEGARAAYPARLEAALVAKLPGVAMSLRTDVRSRRTAADMAKAIMSIPPEAKPTLVVWQTGTADALRGIDPDEFRYALEKTVKKLLASGVDVVLVNMQYSPRTESMITASPYADAMRWVAQQNDVPLFDRTAIMKYWSENGVFDLTGSNGARLAERVHDCIGQVLAATILDTAGIETSVRKEAR